MNKLTSCKLNAAAAIIFASVLTVSAAANHYICAGATGAGTGNNWTDAWTSIPASLTRGDVYYVASGNYGSPSITTSISGTNTITIRKATVADHGTSTGWSDSYGTNQAIFGTITIIDTGYIIIDGAYEYGIRINFGDGGVGVWIGGYTSIDRPGIQLKYLDVAGPGGSLPYAYQAETSCIRGTIFPGNIPNLLISHCAVHGASDLIIVANVQQPIVEYCKLYDNLVDSSGSSQHLNAFWCQYSTDVTYRYNEMWNWGTEGIYIVYTHTGFFKIYGNVFHDSQPGNSGSMCIFPYNPGTYGTLYIYNNTFYNVYYGFHLESGGTITAGYAANNLFYNVQNNDVSAITSDYNWFSGSSTGGEAHGVAGGSVSPFVNAPSRLDIVSTVGSAYPRDKGIAEAAEYGTDGNGNVRGSDGTWDIGAYEYPLSGPSTNPVIQVSPPTLAFGPVAAGASATNTFTVQNAGSGTLSGTAAVATASTNFLKILSGGNYTGANSLGAGQSQVVTVRYSPTGASTDSGSIMCSGGLGAQVNVTGSLLAVLPGLSFPSYAGVITAPFTTNGGYLSQTVDVSNLGQAGVTSGGQAVYAFNISTAGNYTVSASVNAPNSSSKSFWVNMDALPTDPDMIWDNYPYTIGFETRTVSWRGSGTFTNDQYVPSVFSLSAGTHQLIVVGRDASVQLGQITIALYNASRPTPPPSPGQTSALGVIQIAPLTVQAFGSAGVTNNLSYDFGDGSSSTNTNPVHAYANAGTYTVSLTATDGSGRNLTSHFVITVTP